MSKQVTTQKTQDYTKENRELFLQLLVGALFCIAGFLVLVFILAMLGANGSGHMPWSAR